MTPNLPFPSTLAFKRVCEAIIQAGGKPIAVGGCVRDFLLAIPIKDFDIEVYELPLEQLQQTLSKLGQVHAVGKSFGVLKVSLQDEPSTVFDVSLPRTENKQGRGHRGFVVETDENLTFEKASSRRDFTINAMGYDVSSDQLLDPHHGQADLENRILRHVSDSFSEDPLRVLRACQFAARFQMTIAPQTLALCQELQPELSTLPKERIFEEMKKLLLAPYPSLGIQALHDTGALALFPELLALQGCQQDPTWHPEGDVWVHTLMVVDQAARIKIRDQLSTEESLILMLGALCHDLGKPATTQFEDGRWRSKMHEPAGETPTRTFLERIGTPSALVEAVVPLVLEHLKPHQLYRERTKISDGAIRRLAARVNIERLCRVNEADSLGRTTEDALRGEEPASLWLLEKARNLSVHQNAPSPLLLGRHLLEHGYTPGPKMGKVLKKAYEAQLDGEFDTLEGALTWLTGA